MESLFYSYNTKVEKAYIICVDSNDKSRELAQRCADSCDKVGQAWQHWSAYDGTKHRIRPPEHLQDDTFMKMLKVTDHYMTRGEVACALSHISLWARCASIDRPIVILEHDAVMLAAYGHHRIYNSICYLGGKEQVQQGWQVLPTPPHSAEGPNYHFICRAHAYAIDPPVAKNLLSHVLKMGIHAPLDIMMRADIFPMHQMGIFAYEEDGCPGPGRSPDTIIAGRPEFSRSAVRNDDLSV